MQCPECRSTNPEVAAYCHRCGRALRTSDGSKHGRGSVYALQSAESPTQFALVSTLMPHTNRKAADNYRWALAIGVGLVLTMTLIGVPSAAILAGACLIPVVYLFYLYDVNLWEETPLPVILLLFLGTGVLATVVSLLFYNWVFEDEFQTLLISRAGLGSVDFGALLVFAFLLPVVAELVKNTGPLALINRFGFDDMIDGVTFGVAAGTAYAAFETVVAFGPVFTGETHVAVNGTWLVVILNLMIVKPLIYGTATGIAVGAYSGRGEGVDGMTSKYATNFAFAVGMNVLYWLGARLLSYATFGAALTLIWGGAIAAFLVVRMRLMLHAALLEAAVEDAASSKRSKAATTDGGFCPECEMNLLADAMFCIVCGTSVRATTAQGRKHVRSRIESGATA